MAFFKIPKWHFILPNICPTVTGIVGPDGLNVCSAEKYTKRSYVLPLRLVNFSAEQTLFVTLGVAEKTS